MEDRGGGRVGGRHDVKDEPGILIQCPKKSRA